MKRYIIIFITFFLFVLFPFIPSYASSFVLDPVTLGELSAGAESMQYNSFVINGLLPSSGVSSQSLQDLINSELQKSTHTTITNDDITSVQSLSSVDYDIISQMEGWEFVYSDGTTVLPSEWGDLRYCTFDNGFYSGECIVGGDGKLVLRNISGVSENEQMANIRLGGSEVSKSEYSEAVSNVHDFVANHNFTYNYSNPSSTVDPSYYFCWADHYDVYSLYIGNQYLPGHIVPAKNSGYFSSWYSNDLSILQYSHLYGDGGSGISIQEGNFSYNGYNYRYYIGHNAGAMYGGTAVSLQSWLDNPNRPARSLFGQYGYSVNNNLMSADVATFIPTDVDTVLDLGNSLALSYVLDLASDFADSIAVPDLAYDPSLPISATNKAISVPIETEISDVIAVPVTPSITIPGDDEIEISDSLPGVIPGGTEFEIPFIQNLQTKFPFSIPWDIKNLLKGLRAVRQVPKFEISWYISPLDYTWNFSLDLTDFEPIASLFRNCILILFIIGLCRFSYDHFFGS